MKQQNLEGKIEQPDEVYITVQPGLWTHAFLNKCLISLSFTVMVTSHESYRTAICSPIGSPLYNNPGSQGVNFGR
ncbi:MAG: hypothetical protein EAZ09_25265 [Oscillatoriales cyanobacterium]|nr:MAG: hypothetical protein EAZ18_21455 [Oscillatoriales cyanobacterium]TAH15108.1 MAG: hypothetical protein EAZ09_25265 [Oscillatoriales cyanobacterium]